MHWGKKDDCLLSVEESPPLVPKNLRHQGVLARRAMWMLQGTLLEGGLCIKKYDNNYLLNRTNNLTSLSQILFSFD